jgi:phenylpyruvate tautomerase PptA (4-oxalocrotonate tautomerase family)
MIMPFINTKTNIAISKEKELVMKQKLGQAIELIPGKSENWLMLSFEDESSLYFKGLSDKPIAFVEVKLFGGSTDEAYQRFTAEVTDILNNELGIDPSQIFVRYEETKHWGWNGNNF